MLDLRETVAVQMVLILKYKQLKRRSIILTLNMLSVANLANTK